MKKIFFALLCVAACACLWAQEGSIVYDTVMTKSRFSYSVGLRYSYEFADVNAIRMIRPQNLTTEAFWHGFSPVFQADWKYFVLDIAPSFYIIKTGNDEDSFFTGGGSIQPLLKLPFSDLLRDHLNVQVFNTVYFSLLTGPEIMYNNGFACFFNGGFDLGFTVGDHHILFFEFLGGGSLTDFDERVPKDLLEAVSRDLKNSTKFQFTLGIKTRILEDVFYLKGKEVARRRR
jgi:hypothetical protein